MLTAILILRCRLGEDVVRVLVGREKKAHAVHENLIRASSPFFDKAMTDEWKKSSQRTVELLDDEPEAFALYVYWLYFRTFPVIGDQSNPSPRNHAGLIKTYIMGIKLLDQTVQNAAIDAMIEATTIPDKNGSRWYPGEAKIEYVYEITNSSAPIRELLLDMHLFHGSSQWLRGEASTDYPQSFLLELAARLLERRGASREPLDPKKYHCREERDDDDDKKPQTESKTN